MSNRSVYPEGVEVHQRHLANTEAQRTASDKQILFDATTRGVLSGLSVVVANSPNDTRLNIAPGSAYAPNGEFMVLAAGQNGVALADYTLGLKNYVLLVYDETQIGPESHESDGTTRQTLATITPRLTVLTEAAYNALSLDSLVLTSNDKNRSCILAIVTANGPSVPLTAGSIQSPTIYQNVLQSSQPIAILGVVIIAIDPTTATGNGTLAYTASGTSLTWQAPGEGSPGAPTTVTSSGVYIVTSSGGKTLQLNIAASELPLANQNDTITIVNIYSEKIPRHSAEDFQHRTLVGSGVPTPRNAHGLTLADLASGTGDSVEEHQDIMHANGFAKISSPNLLLSTVNVSVGTDSLTAVNFTTGDYAFINGKRIQSLTNSNTIAFSDVLAFNPALYDVWLGQDGNLYKKLRALYPNPSLLFVKAQIINVHGFPSGGSIGLTWDTGNILSLTGGHGKSAPSVDTLIRLYAGDEVSYVDVWVKGAQAAPGVTQVDTVVLSALPVLEENLPVCSVPFTGAGAGSLGYGFGVDQSPNRVFDRRTFGTLDESNVNDYSGITNGAAATSDLLGSGIWVRPSGQPGDTNNQETVLTATGEQLNLGSLAFPNIPLEGGVVYVDGHRFEVPSASLLMTNNSTNRIFVNSRGILEVSTDTWPNIIANHVGQRIVRLWEEVIVTSAESSRVDVREYIGQRRNEALGVLALDKWKRVNITSDPAAPSGASFQFAASGAANQDCIIAVGIGTGAGVRGSGGATGDGVVGSSGGGSNAAGTVGVTIGNATGSGVAGVIFGFGGVPVGRAGVLGVGDLVSATTCPDGTGVAGVGGAGGQGNGGHFLAASGSNAAAVFGQGATGGGFAQDGFGGEFVGGTNNGAGVRGKAGGTFAAGVVGLGFGVPVPAGQQKWGVYGRGLDYGVFGEGWTNGSGVLGTAQGLGHGGVFFANGTGNAIQVGVGHAKFTGGNPSGTTAYSNTLTPKNIIKAWISFRGNDTASPVVLDSFNVASITQSGTGATAATMTVTWAQAFSNANYCVLFIDHYSQYGISTASKVAGSLQFQFVTYGTGTPTSSATIAALVGRQFHLAVLGAN